jgi:hypothetical protein
LARSSSSSTAFSSARCWSTAARSRPVPCTARRTGSRWRARRSARS